MRKLFGWLLIVGTLAGTAWFYSELIQWDPDIEYREYAVDSVGIPQVQHWVPRYTQWSGMTLAWIIPAGICTGLIMLFYWLFIDRPKWKGIEPDL